MAGTSVTFGFRLDPVSARRVKEAAAAARQDTSTFLREVVRRGLADGDLQRAVAAEVRNLRAELNGLRTELIAVRGQLAHEGAEVRGLLKRAVAGLLMATTGSTEGFGAEYFQQLGGRAPVQDTAHEAKRAVTRALESLTRQQSHFTERELPRAAFVEAQGGCLWGARVDREVTEILGREQEIVSLGRRGSAIHYTTRDMLAVEKSLLDAAEHSKANTQHALKTEKVAALLQSHPELNAEQRRAVEHVTLEPGSIKLVSGMAGTGKSTMLRAARECWERENYREIGAALAGEAARSLSECAGIKSHTLAKLIGSEELGFVGDFDRQRAGRDPIRLDSRSVLVVDEAGMLGTPALERLTREAERAGAKLVLVGDATQLQPIEAGGPFKSLAERLSCATLETIVRQKDEWARQAVKEFASGEAAQALQRFAAQGLVHVSKDRDAAIEALIRSYTKDGLDPESVQQKLIFTGSRLEAASCNARVQAARLAAGELRGDGVLHGNVMLYEGDRVRFTRNSRVLDGPTGQTVRVSLADYGHIKHAYSATTHAGQGKTTSRAWVLAGGLMTDLHLSYVQMSRARDVCEIHVDRAEAGKDLEELAHAMSRGRTKDLAQDLMVAPNQQALARHLHPECSWELQLEHRL